MIAISGLDGAGKSTQIELLKKHLEQQDKKVLVFWSRGGYTPLIEGIKRYLRKSKAPGLPAKQGKSEAREQAFKKKHIRKLWLTIAVLDLIIQYGVVLRYKQLVKYQIICDRYLLDTQLDFEINFPNENVASWWIWKLLKNIALKPKNHFILTVSVEESQRRSILKQEPFPDSADVLQYRLTKYLEYCQIHNHVHHIDCQKTVMEVAAEIQKKIGL